MIKLFGIGKRGIVLTLFLVYGLFNSFSSILLVLFFSEEFPAEAIQLGYVLPFFALSSII